MKILVRLPSLLGDTIMTFPFLDLLHEQYPDAVIDVIVQKPLIDLCKAKPYIKTAYPFSKKEFRGLAGLYRFGRMIMKQRKYDIYFSLKTSFSSALLGYFTRSTVRVGYKKEMRSFLLTHSYRLPSGLHFTEQFVHLLSLFKNQKFEVLPVVLPVGEVSHLPLPEGKNMVFNVNSAVQSRRLPQAKAVSLIEDFSRRYDFNIILVGSPGEAAFVKKIKDSVSDKSGIFDYTGKTTLEALAWLMKKADIVVSADSGIAHMANAVGTPLVVIWGGCGIEGDTRPYNRKNTIILKEDLPCAPCWPNKTCKFGDPLCILNTENARVMKAIDELMVQ